MISRITTMNKSLRLLLAMVLLIGAGLNGIGIDKASAAEGYPNLALNKSATSSMLFQLMTHDEVKPENAVDGNTSTYWVGYYGTGWLQIDLGEETEFNQWDIVVEQVSDYNLEISLDGTSYTAIDSGTIANRFGDSISGSSGDTTLSARYVKLNVTKSWGDNDYAPKVSEFRIYNSVKPDAPAITDVTAGDRQATVSFTPPQYDGGSPIVSYTVTTDVGGFTASGSESPITVTGLTNYASYKFYVTATNEQGVSSNLSGASGSVTPAPASAQYAVASSEWSEEDPGVAGQDLEVTLKVMNSSHVVDATFDGEHEVSVTGYSAAPDGTYGSFDGAPLTGEDDAFAVEFVDGEAIVHLKLNSAGAASLQFVVAGVAHPEESNTLNLALEPGASNAMRLKRDIAAPGSQGGAFAKQPIVELVDEFGNRNVNDNETVVTASQKDSGSWTLTGTTQATALNGLAAFSDLGALNVEGVTGAQLSFAAEGMETIESGIVALEWAAPDAAPVVSATGGDGRVQLTWSAVESATDYKIYISEVAGQYATELASVSGSVYSYEAAGLTNGKTYYFVVKASNPGGDSDASGEVSVTPAAAVIVVPDSPTPSPSPMPAPDAEILVNGVAKSAGTLTTETVGDRKQTKVKVDPQKLKDIIGSSQSGIFIDIPVLTGSDVAVVELSGQTVEELANSQGTVNLRTENGSYALPVQLINLDAIVKQLGSASLQGVSIRIEIARADSDAASAANQAAANGGFSLVGQPLNFTVKAVYGDKANEVSSFNQYVERSIAIPEGVDPNRITTAVVVDPDGTVRHVPTKIVVVDGKYYAKVNSLTNSVYSLVWNPLEFADVKGHWAQDAVNDMGSRLIVNGIEEGKFNPAQEITRAEFAAIVVRGLGLKLGEGTNVFVDVNSSDWYSGAVRTAASYGLIRGYEDGTFRPSETITRQEAMAIITNAIGIAGSKTEASEEQIGQLLSLYADGDQVAGWARSGVAASLTAGIVNGRDGSLLAPGAKISRAEVAVIVRRLLQQLELI